MPPNGIYDVNAVCTKPIYNHLLKYKRIKPTCVDKCTETYPDFQNASDDLWPNKFNTVKITLAKSSRPSNTHSSIVLSPVGKRKNVSLQINVRMGL